jgi:hypothetical protein
VDRTHDLGDERYRRDLVDDFGVVFGVHAEGRSGRRGVVDRRHVIQGAVDEDWLRGIRIPSLPGVVVIEVIVHRPGDGSEQGEPGRRIDHLSGDRRRGNLPADISVRVLPIEEFLH